MADITYPFDPTGLAASNVVAGEQQTVTSVNYRDYYFLIPEFAPFFTNNFVARLHANGNVRDLVEGVDYTFVLPYVAATRSIGQIVYGGISLVSSSINGIVELSYRTLGGEWTANRTTVLETLAERLYNPKLTVWDLVTDKQTTFPPINHSLDIAQVFGQSELIQAILSLGTALGTADRNALLIHMLDNNNPHQVTKAQVGLGLVENLPLSSDLEILNKTSVSKLVTLRQILNLLSTYTFGTNTTVPTYVVSSVTSVSEATDLVVTVNTTNVPDGHIVYWNIAHGTTVAADFTAVQGMAVVYSNTCTFTIKSINDVYWENPETFQIEVRDASNTGVLLTIGSVISLLNVAGTPTYSVAPASGTVKEGFSLAFNVSVTRVPDATVFYWKVVHGTTTAADFAAVQGTVVVNGNAGTFNVSALTDALLEGDEVFSVELRSGSYTGTVVATSSNVVLTDATLPITYSLAATTSSVNEGSTFTMNVTGANVPDNTTLYWTVNHGSTTSADFVAVQGTVNVVGNQATFNVGTITDVAETANKIFTVSVRTGNYTNTPVATCGTLTIVNVVTITYGLAVAGSPVNEGGNVTGTITTTGLPNGTVLYWTIAHGTTSAADFAATSGSTTLLNNSATFTINAVTDLLAESTETFGVSVRTGSVSGAIVATASSLSLVNVVPPPTYSLGMSGSSVNEGGSLTGTITTANVTDGTVLYWTVLHVTTSAADFVATSGSAAITNNTGTFTVSAVTDLLAESTETFSVDVRTVSTSGTIVASGGLLSLTNVVPPVTYSVGASASFVSEGNSVTGTITTTNATDGTVLYWTINHGTTSAADFTATSGSATITNNTATFAVAIANDVLTESSETFSVDVRTVSVSGTVVASTPVVTITNVVPPATYSVAVSTTSINEGGSVVGTLTTTNVADGTVLYWTVNHATTTTADFVAVSGNTTVTGNTATFTVSAATDLLAEGTETFSVDVRTVSVAGTVVASTQAMSVVNVVPPPTYSVGMSVSSVSEGVSVTGTITTTNTADGTVLYWTVNNATTSAADFALTAGTATVTGNSASFVVDIVNDALAESTETFSVDVRTVSASGTVVASSSAVSVLNTTYGLTGSVAVIKEGTRLLYSVATTNVLNGTVLYWTIAHGTTSAADFDKTSGSVVINGNAGSFSFTPAIDNLWESINVRESFAVQLRTNSSSGTVVATSTTIPVTESLIDAYTAFDVFDPKIAIDARSYFLLAMK